MAPKENGLYLTKSTRIKIQLQTLWCSEQLCASELFAYVIELNRNLRINTCLCLHRHGALSKTTI